MRSPPEDDRGSAPVDVQDWGEIRQRPLGCEARARLIETVVEAGRVSSASAIALARRDRAGLRVPRRADALEVEQQESGWREVALQYDTSPGVR